MSSSAATALKFQVGNVISPVTAGTAGTSLIATCDPALYGLGSYFFAVLRAKLDTAFAAAAQFVGHTHAVGEVVYQDPREFWPRTWIWPLLALWRANESWEQQTLAYDRCNAVVKGVYVLPPLTYEYFGRIAHVRHAVVTALRGALEAHGDPSYLSGADVLSALGIERIWLTKAEFESVPSENMQQVHPTVAFELALSERQMPNTTSSDISTATNFNTTIDFDDTPDYTDVVDMYYDPTA